MESRLDFIGNRESYVFGFYWISYQDLGNLKYFIGVEIGLSSHGISLSQRKHALDLLGETRMLGWILADSLMDCNIKLESIKGDLCLMKADTQN